MVETPKQKKVVKKQRPLTIKQKKFIKEVVETGNATQSVLNSYPNIKSKNVAAVVWHDNLRKANIVQGIEDRLRDAKDMIYTIATTSEKDDTKLRACQDIIDRVEWKATQKIEWKVDGDLVIKIVNYGSDNTAQV